MTKSELVDALAASRNLSRRTAEEIVHVVFDAMAEALVEGRRIEIRGFGSFKVREYQGYTGRNPRTGTAIEVKPKVLPVFKVGKALRSLVNQDTHGGNA
jgi:integration host factor subunit beta